MDKSLIWFVLFALITIVSFLVVPKRKYFRLLPFGVFAGSLLSLAIFLLAVPWIELWKFSFISGFSIYGIPIFLTLTFLPTVVIFTHFAPLFHERNMLVFWVLIFTTASTFLQGLLQQGGFIVFLNWNLLAGLLLSFAIYSFLALFIINYETASPTTIDGE